MQRIQSFDIIQTAKFLGVMYLIVTAVIAIPAAIYCGYVALILRKPEGLSFLLLLLVVLFTNVALVALAGADPMGLRLEFLHFGPSRFAAGVRLCRLTCGKALPFRRATSRLLRLWAEGYAFRPAQTLWPAIQGQISCSSET